MSERSLNDITVGTAVQIKSLKKNGTVTEVLGRERYRVSIGSLSIIIPLTDLLLRKSDQPEKALKIAPRSAKAAKLVKPLDLHGMKVADAIASFDTWLNRAILADCEVVTVIHGHGTGKLKDAVYKRLGELSVVKSFRVNEQNRGETLIYL